MVDFVYRSIINNPSPIDYIIVVVNTTSFHITFIVHVVAVYLSQHTFLVLIWGIKALDQINSLLVLGVVTSLSSCIEFLCFSVCVHVSLSSLLLLGFSVFLCACMSFFLCQCVQVCLALIFLCWEFLCLSVCGCVLLSSSCAGSFCVRVCLALVFLCWEFLHDERWFLVQLVHPWSSVWTRSFERHEVHRNDTVAFTKESSWRNLVKIKRLKTISRAQNHFLGSKSWQSRTHTQVRVSITHNTDWLPKQLLAKVGGHVCFVCFIA